ncbi:translesion error-prone DNA polymerase V autoproteolytic subunit [Chitinibacter fontanus]|uniref:Translesion error-prone DNA polymerase V autoproteolytic subunit n=1 Tax=Chitinibacter fontanus TaxID=1737446 RepID=A0A7D5VAT5_9NEIS|nr:translesion error-prone DNA polymerase V autoproteolytic subunit [Chitinibacter fontanus]QLI81693.1 translesion error-prone DNA polymerase V autoproteolytic subunit [Chitinibacter fontanus]
MASFLSGPWAAQASPVSYELPFIGSVSAGFPSPAADWSEERVDLNLRYISHPEATFYFTVSGDSMVSVNPERSIPDGALLIVDRALAAQHNDIVVAIVDNDFTVKRLFQRQQRLALLAENPAYAPIILGDEQELVIWGVVRAWIVEAR